VITDRNDLDDQLFGTFAANRDLLRQTPVQAEGRDHLRRLLSVASGGVVFTTIQKFMPDEHGEPHPVLSERGNIVVIADEAHRSQYDLIDGLALPARRVRAICATRSRTRRSSASPARRSRRPTPIRARSDSQAHFQTHSRSKTVAKPWPTPTQSDAMPREAPVRAIWWISVVARRAPLQPSG